MADKNRLAYFFYQKHNDLYPVPQIAIDIATQHAIEVFPHESVGVVASGQYFRLRNVHEDPENFFEVNPRELLEVEQMYGKIQAVIHSHTKCQFGASKADMESQLATGVPYGIITMDRTLVRDFIFFGDGTPIAPYEGRPFKDGIYDCFALCRDWLKQEMGIIIPNYPRDPVWWEDDKGTNLIIDNFRKEGFVELEFSQLQRGDIVVGSLLSSDRTNHCGVYVGDGRVLHHLYGNEVNPRVSGHDVIYSWKRMIHKCLRYQGGLQVPAINANA